MDVGLDTPIKMVCFSWSFTLDYFTKQPLIYFIILGSWKSISSIPGTTCPDNIVGGTDSQSKAGTCARTWSTSSNKLISYVCGIGVFSYDYICQKPKERT